jgi:hypothetical protein
VQQADLGPNLTTDFYGNGVHAWSYWQRSLASFLTWLRPQLNQSLVPPSAFTFRTARAESGAWGWSFRHRSGLTIANVNTAEQFVYLSRVSSSGFTAAGNGTLAVTTPAHSYPARSQQTVTAGRVTRTVTADAAGRLTFNVVIGPPATHAQTVFPAAGAPVNVPHVDVSITPVPAAVTKSTSGGSVAWLVALGVVGLAIVALVTVGIQRRPRRAA